MSIGMTYDEFWYGEASRAKYYRKAHELRERRQNEVLWLQGAYVYDALCNASPLFRISLKKGVVKPDPYAKEPYPITKAEIQERKERERRKKEEAMKAAFAQFVANMRINKPHTEAQNASVGGEVNVGSDNH